MPKTTSDFSGEKSSATYIETTEGEKQFCGTHTLVCVDMLVKVTNLMGDLVKLAKMRHIPTHIHTFYVRLLARFYFISVFGNSTFLFL